MKKILVSVFVVLFAISCETTSKSKTSTPAPTPAPTPPPAPAKIVVIDHKGEAYGRSMPKWMDHIIDGEISKIANLYPKKVPFVYTERGPNITVLERRVNSVGINNEVAKTVASASVANAKNKFGSGGMDEVSLNEFSQAIEAGARASFSGLIKEGDWWILKKYPDGKQEYEYSVLYLIDEQLFAKQVSGLTDNAAKKLNDNSLAEAVKKDVNSTIDLFKKVQEQ